MTEATPSVFRLSAPVYHGYNRLTTVCSYNAGGVFLGRLRLIFNGNSTYLGNMNVARPFGIGCGEFAVVPDSSGYKWTISVVLHSCDRVQLQCGHRSDGRLSFSNAVSLSVVRGEKMYYIVVLRYIPCTSYSIAIFWQFFETANRLFKTANRLFKILNATPLSYA